MVVCCLIVDLNGLTCLMKLKSSVKLTCCRLLIPHTHTQWYWVEVMITTRTEKVIGSVPIDVPSYRFSMEAPFLIETCVVQGQLSHPLSLFPSDPPLSEPPSRWVRRQRKNIHWSQAELQFLHLRMRLNPANLDNLQNCKEQDDSQWVSQKKRSRWWGEKKQWRGYSFM